MTGASAHRLRVVLATLAADAVGAAAQTIPQTFRLEPDIVIEANAHDLSPIGWLAVSEDGTIIISQPQDHRLRYFSSAGRAVAAFGRKGKGPGEFETPNLHGWLGDTLWVGDIDTKRMTLVSNRHSLLRTQPWPPGIRFRDGTPGPLPNFIFAVPWAMYRDGTLLTFAYLATENVPAWMRRPPGSLVPFIRVSGDGLFQDVVAWIPRPDDACYINTPASRTTKPFCFQPFWAVSSPGGIVVTVRLERSDARNDFIRVVAVGARGDTVFSRATAVTRVNIPSAIADSVRDSFVKRLWRGVPAPSFAIPETFPSYIQAIIARDESSIWLERGITTGDRFWDILDITGRERASVRVPRNVSIRAATMERVWATQRDDDGLESVVVFRVIRS